MTRITRRACLQGAAYALSAGVVPGLIRPLSALAEAPPLPTNHEAATIADIVTQTMRAYHAPALSLAIASRGQWVYQQGFGLADQRTGELATAASRFRIASLTKPITAVAIFSLIEQGRLGLHDPVFGQRGLLAVDDGARYPDLVSQITLHHLLTHTGGGWSNDDADPMFRHPEMNHQLGRVINCSCVGILSPDHFKMNEEPG